MRQTADRCVCAGEKLPCYTTQDHFPCSCRFRALRGVCEAADVAELYVGRNRAVEREVSSPWARLAGVSNFSNSATRRRVTSSSFEILAPLGELSLGYGAVPANPANRGTVEPQVIQCKDDLAGQLRWSRPSGNLPIMAYALRELH